MVFLGLSQLAVWALGPVIVGAVKPWLAPKRLSQRARVGDTLVVFSRFVQKIKFPSPQVTVRPPAKKQIVAKRLGQFRFEIPVIECPDVHPPA